MAGTKIKWKLRLLVALAAIIFFLVSSHLVLNTEKIQNYLTDTANRFFNISLKTDQLHFNGATGHFSGERLDLKVPKARFSISLRGFRVAISPVSLVFGKVRLIDLQAEAVSIDLEALPKAPGDKPPQANPKPEYGSGGPRRGGGKCGEVRYYSLPSRGRAREG